MSSYLFDASPSCNIHCASFVVLRFSGSVLVLPGYQGISCRLQRGTPVPSPGGLEQFPRRWAWLQYFRILQMDRKMEMWLYGLEQGNHGWLVVRAAKTVASSKYKQERKGSDVREKCNGDRENRLTLMPGLLQHSFSLRSREPDLPSRLRQQIPSEGSGPAPAPAP